MTIPRRVRVWVIVSPTHGILYASTERSVCVGVLNSRTHEQRGDITPRDQRSMRRAGWRVRRLKPEEVKP